MENSETPTTCRVHLGIDAYHRPADGRCGRPAVGTNAAGRPACSLHIRAELRARNPHRYRDLVALDRTLPEIIAEMSEAR